MRRIEIHLRTHQHSWLRRVADRDDLSVARVLGEVIQASESELLRRQPTKKCRAHVHMADEHIAILERLAAEAGIDRSEMARRMIDQSMRR